MFVPHCSSSPFCTWDTNFDSRTRYYVGLDESPAYYAAVSLHPEMKFAYFEQEWRQWPYWINKAKEDVIRFWENEYRDQQHQAAAHETADDESGKCTLTLTLCALY